MITAAFGVLVSSPIQAQPLAVNGNLTVSGNQRIVGDATMRSAQVGTSLVVGTPPETPCRPGKICPKGVPDPNARHFTLEVLGDASVSGNTITGDEIVNQSLVVNGTVAFGRNPRQELYLYGAEYGIGIQNNGLYQRSAADFYWYKGGEQTTAQSGGGVALMHLDKDGTLFTFKVVTPVLQITGGADVAEPFAMGSETVPQGSVVVIDDEHPGRLKVSGQAYDTRVAGIVSGANGVHPGISLSQQDVLEGGQNVALSGRVYVLADASGGAIQPGDLLTTSDRPGYAMRASDHARALGAVIGKAMGAMKEGAGMLLVLVTLQ